MKKLWLVIYILVSNADIYSFELSELFKSPTLFAPIINYNRATLAKIPKWFESNVYQNAIFSYGLPESVKHLIDVPVGNEITYSDMICFLSKTLKNPLVYLEMGVSCGKNFFQIMNFLHNATLVGYDFEFINPTLERWLQNHKNLDEWATMPNSMKKTNSAFHQYSYESNLIYYLNGDVFDENSWKRLQGLKFNLIFSDAYHTPEALLNEYVMVNKFDLLDEEEFIFIWDDLGGDMTNAFNKIFDLMKIRYDLPNNAKAIVQVRGWLGMNEQYHNVGIIMKQKK